MTHFLKKTSFVAKSLLGVGIIGGVGYKLANTEKEKKERYGCYGRPKKYISKNQKDVAGVVGET
tara:strand:- start:780 stop:971 length:192 start_codon:yes stop_codon:yes gene_type:complete